jgi:YD repeat-containing protein
MSDLAKWKLHGSVHTLRIEHAEWDLGKEEWQAPRHSTLVQFLPNCKISENESHNPDGSVLRSSYSYHGDGRIIEVRSRMNGDPVGKTIYSYDDAGRLVRVVDVGHDGIERETEAYRYSPEGKRTKIFVVPKMEPNAGFGYAIEGTELFCSAAGAATIATAYDEEGRPDEILLYDAENTLLQSVTLKRDTTGRLVKVQMNLGEQLMYPEMQASLADMLPKALETTAARVAGLFGAIVTEYAYDHKGRLLERCMRMGNLGEGGNSLNAVYFLRRRSKYHYDDYDNEIEETMEHTSSGSFHRQDVRFEYRYDAQWNWTERAVWSRLEPNPDFQRSNVTRREITYYAS